MRKIINWALGVGFALAATASALTDSNSVAEFVFNTCQPAMDDVGKVEDVARENHWSSFGNNRTSESK